VLKHKVQRLHLEKVISYIPTYCRKIGKYFQEHQLQKEDHRNGYFAQFDRDQVQAFLKAITPLAEQKSASLAQLVLRWTTLQSGITVVLAGARNASQAIQNAQAMDVNLSAEELHFIEK